MKVKRRLENDSSKIMKECVMRNLTATFIIVMVHFWRRRSLSHF